MADTEHVFAANATVRAAELDPASGRVSVLLVDGSTKTYANFTQALFDDWRAAEKPAAWFNNRIRQRAKAHPEVVEILAPAPEEPAQVVDASGVEPLAFSKETLASAAEIAPDVSHFRRDVDAELVAPERPVEKARERPRDFLRRKLAANKRGE